MTDLIPSGPESRALIPEEDTDLGRFLDEETGEVIEVPKGKDNGAWFAYQHFWAGLQSKAWEKRKAIFGRLIQRYQDANKAAYSDPEEGTAVVAAIKQSSYPVFNAQAFASDLSTALQREESPIGVLEVVTLMLASKGFSIEKLPKGSPMRALVEKHTEKRAKNPWVETEVKLELTSGR